MPRNHHSSSQHRLSSTTLDNDMMDAFHEEEWMSTSIQDDDILLMEENDDVDDQDKVQPANFMALWQAAGAQADDFDDLSSIHTPPLLEDEDEDAFYDAHVESNSSLSLLEGQPLDPSMMLHEYSSHSTDYFPDHGDDDDSGNSSNHSRQKTIRFADTIAVDMEQQAAADAAALWDIQPEDPPPPPLSAQSFDSMDIFGLEEDDDEDEESYPGSYKKEEGTSSMDEDASISLSRGTSSMDDEDASMYSTDDEDSVDEEDRKVKRQLLYAVGGAGAMALVGWATLKVKSFFEKSSPEEDLAGATGDVLNGTTVDPTAMVSDVAQTIAVHGGDGGVTAATTATTTATTSTTTATTGNALWMAQSAANIAQASMSQTTLGAMIGGGATTTTTVAEAGVVVAQVGTVATKTAVVQTLAVSAAGSAGAGAASATTAVATAAAAGAAATTSATVSTIATVAVVATAGSAVSYSHAEHETSVVQSALAVCSPSPVNATGFIRVAFSEDEDLPSRTELQELFQEIYNDVSPQCQEMFERQTRLPKLLEIRPRSDFGIDTFWSANVLCFPQCPSEALFGDSLASGGEVLETDTDTGTRRTREEEQDEEQDEKAPKTLISFPEFRRRFHLGTSQKAIEFQTLESFEIGGDTEPASELFKITVVGDVVTPEVPTASPRPSWSPMPSNLPTSSPTTSPPVEAPTASPTAPTLSPKPTWTSEPSQLPTSSPTTSAPVFLEDSNNAATQKPVAPVATAVQPPATSPITTPVAPPVASPVASPVAPPVAPPVVPPGVSTAVPVAANAATTWRPLPTATTAPLPATTTPVATITQAPVSSVTETVAAAAALDEDPPETTTPANGPTDLATPAVVPAVPNPSVGQTPVSATVVQSPVPATVVPNTPVVEQTDAPSVAPVVATSNVNSPSVGASLVNIVVANQSPATPAPTATPIVGVVETTEPPVVPMTAPPTDSPVIGATSSPLDDGTTLAPTGASPGPEPENGTATPSTLPLGGTFPPSVAPVSSETNVSMTPTVTIAPDVGKNPPLTTNAPTTSSSSNKLGLTNSPTSVDDTVSPAPLPLGGTFPPTLTTNPSSLPEVDIGVVVEDPGADLILNPGTGLLSPPEETTAPSALGSTDAPTSSDPPSSGPITRVKLRKLAGPPQLCNTEGVRQLSGSTYIIPSTTSPWAYCYIVENQNYSQECVTDIVLSDPAPIGGTVTGDIPVTAQGVQLCQGERIFVPGALQMGNSVANTPDGREAGYAATAEATGVDTGISVSWSNVASVRMAGPTNMPSAFPSATPSVYPSEMPSTLTSLGPTDSPTSVDPPQETAAPSEFVSTAAPTPREPSWLDPVTRVWILKLAGPPQLCNAEGVRQLKARTYTIPSTTSPWAYCYRIVNAIYSQECVKNIVLSDPAPIGGTVTGDILVTAEGVQLCQGERIYVPGATQMGISVANTPDGREAGYAATVEATGVDTGTVVEWSNRASVEMAEPTNMPSVFPSTTPSSSPSEIPSAHPSKMPSALPSMDPSSYPSSFPSERPSESISPSEMPSDNPSISLSPSHAPSGIPSGTPSGKPSDTPTTTMAPSDTSSERQGGSAAPSDSASPSGRPSMSMAPSDLQENRDIETAMPSATPSETPSKINVEPSDAPSGGPQAESDAPSGTPSGAAETPSPTFKSTGILSQIPSANPSQNPTSSTTAIASSANSPSPSGAPSTSPPTAAPSPSPSAAPSTSPPTSVPSPSPSAAPSTSPPTAAPSPSPSAAPSTSSPTSVPSPSPSAAPSTSPPTAAPSPSPSSSPTTTPSAAPSPAPTSGLDTSDARQNTCLANTHAGSGTDRRSLVAENGGGPTLNIICDEDTGETKFKAGNPGNGNRCGCCNLRFEWTQACQDLGDSMNGQAAGASSSEIEAACCQRNL